MSIQSSQVDVVRGVRGFTSAQLTSVLESQVKQVWKNAILILKRIFIINIGCLIQNLNILSPFTLQAWPWHILHWSLLEEQVVNSAASSDDAQPRSTTLSKFNK